MGPWDGLSAGTVSVAHLHPLRITLALSLVSALLSCAHEEVEVQLPGGWVTSARIRCAGYRERVEWGAGSREQGVGSGVRGAGSRE
ncbi:hypothetical protein POSPLADRAFT_1061419 [Postia placenta MAD-698-R-SB12]|uniref:Uncharacterized protein n=1 Tax=Postia placenta MAD-698-R-SB12 TaxID=670580 RepID=A0A1X6MNA8_9APHY|nr:hypothetical protein POSPLADRAFT_1061419 [Postia placenta MAD-698-R-SB12]OSX57739.1 hypothetical protein POSPLADRAFT_1061419 [Postia placenta MAD-698-R-SB12]